jgi:hypothetical protein
MFLLLVVYKNFVCFYCRMLLVTYIPINRMYDDGGLCAVVWTTAVVAYFKEPKY